MSTLATNSNLPVVVALTGASGSILGLQLVGHLLQAGCPVELILTDKAQLVMHSEVGLQLHGTAEEKVQQVLTFLKLEVALFHPLLTLHSNKAIGAKPASGTFRTRGMVVAPCSMGTVAKIAHGLADNLTCRAADVTLKEGRKLILMPRETPFNALHLENMLKLSRLGVAMVPPMLAFYQPEFLSFEGQVAYSLGKVLDLLDLPHTLYQRWQGI